MRNSSHPQNWLLCSLERTFGSEIGFYFLSQACDSTTAELHSHCVDPPDPKDHTHWPEFKLLIFRPGDSKKIETQFCLQCLRLVKKKKRRTAKKSSYYMFSYYNLGNLWFWGSEVHLYGATSTMIYLNLVRFSVGFNKYGFLTWHA